LEVDIAYQSQL